MLICSFCVHFLGVVLRAKVKVQEKFAQQHAKLVANHYIRSDLYAAQGFSICLVPKSDCKHSLNSTILQLINSGNIKPNTHVLTLHMPHGEVYYYVRKSVVPGKQYALYRDDSRHNAQALVEELQDLQVEIQTHPHSFTVKVAVTFSATWLEILCRFSKASAAMP